ncbi:MAG: uroporphyrinogen decarboxylase, partial [Gammaproteobacteria bacterium]|nr:uroporphyrinogen decarboxylase [Gammaproteobacteria bacterium]
LDYKPGVGPVIDNPIRSEKDVDNFHVVPAAEGTGYIASTVRGILDGLPPDIALIGFAGAPFTLASYAIEGQGSRNYIYVKRMMYTNEVLFSRLMCKLVDAVIGYVNLQIDSGVHAIQLFDSWIGCLSEGDYARYVASHMGRLMKAITGRVPVIYFGTGNAHLVDAMFAVGPDVFALDWRTPLRATWERLGSVAVQGNMDPIVLCSDRAAIARHAQSVLDEADGKPGHIFNLGHGIVPDTPVDNVKYLVDYVHKHSAR